MSRWHFVVRRWLGVVLFLVVFLLSSVSRSVNDWIWNQHPDLAKTIEAQHSEIFRIGQDVRRWSASPLHLSTLTTWAKHSVTEVPLNVIGKDVLSAILDYALAAWLFTRSGLRFWIEVLKLTFKMIHTLTPYVAPPIILCVHEFAALPLRGQFIILTSLAVNTCLYVAWRKRLIARSMEALSKWHRRVADFCIAVGPYVIVILLLYLPTKHALSFNQFRVVFQSIIFGLSISQSTITAAQLLYLKRTSQEKEVTTRTPHPATARPAAAISPATSWLTTIVTPRTSLSPRPAQDVEKAQTATAVRSYLTFWAVIICFHAVIYFPEKWIECLIGAPLPIYNIWHIGRSYVSPTKHLVLTRGAFANDQLEGILFSSASTSGIWRRWPRLLTTSWLALEEVTTLILFLAAITNDFKVLQVARKACIWVMETSVHSTTGIKVELVPFNQWENETQELQTGAIGRLITSAKGYLQRRGSEYRSITVLLHLEKLGDLLLHLSSLIFLITPSFILRYILLTTALFIPMIYSIKGLQQNNMGKVGYWLTYSTGLMLYICCMDLCAFSSPIAAWITFSLRPKFVAVLILQLICVEPDTLTVWVVKQASRMSVSALATARRHAASAKSPDIVSQSHLNEENYLSNPRPKGSGFRSSEYITTHKKKSRPSSPIRSDVFEESVPLSDTAIDKNSSTLVSRQTSRTNLESSEGTVPTKSIEEHLFGRQNGVDVPRRYKMKRSVTEFEEDMFQTNRVRKSKSSSNKTFH